MKRYQCIKNYYVGPNPAFKAGSVYPFFTIDNTDLIGVVDNFGTTHVVDEDLITIFQELLDLHVDNDYAVDQDEKHVYPTAAPGISTGCAIVAVFVLTVLAIAFAIVNEMAG